MQNGLANVVTDPIEQAKAAALPVINQLAQAADNAVGQGFSDLGTGAHNLLDLLQRGSGQSGAQLLSNVPNGASGADLLNLINRAG